jgi:uncharacterized membrane protein
MKKQLDIKPNKSLNHKQIILFLIITGGLIFFMGVRFVIVGAWPILIFGIVEFFILVFCTYLYFNFAKKKERIILNQEELKIQKLNDQKIEDDQSYNLHWSKLKNNKDDLTVHYAGKKKYIRKIFKSPTSIEIKKNY